MTPCRLDNVATKLGYSKWHLQQIFKDITDTPSALHPNQKAIQNHRVYTIAPEPHYLPEKMPVGQLDFILMVYGSCLPMLRLRRRNRHDIERFYLKGDRQPP
ncbi:hypothetical protein M5G07_08425 [Serratia symbiotica]|nr:hypothetical protein [Serratia symbiotica]